MDWKLEVVVVPVTDVDAAREFYAEKLGFRVDHDSRPAPERRIVQVTPPGSPCSMVFGTGMGDGPPGSLRGTRLVVTDLAAARERLLAQGVEVSGVRHLSAGRWVDGPGGRWNSFVFFEDPDGNSWTVQERAA
ncbi:VOC family protein [Catenuloplanes japonicus]|uniref:VOC family protein n=1 Tax=Catenuloplanes japonicus TaxID=33876 RepID=UPI000527A8D7|nr:VOC family protein [Catenuloplanes japonicus]